MAVCALGARGGLPRPSNESGTKGFLSHVNQESRINKAQLGVRVSYTQLSRSAIFEVSTTAVVATARTTMMVSYNSVMNMMVLVSHVLNPFGSRMSTAAIPA